MSLSFFLPDSAQSYQFTLFACMILEDLIDSETHAWTWWTASHVSRSSVSALLGPLLIPKSSSPHHVENHHGGFNLAHSNFSHSRFWPRRVLSVFPPLILGPWCCAHLKVYFWPTSYESYPCIRSFCQVDPVGVLLPCSSIVQMFWVHPCKGSVLLCLTMGL